MALRCLIIDDNIRFGAAARALLEREGVDVVGVATSGDEAAWLIRKLQPDVALVDIQLGRESGFELARRLVYGPGRVGTNVILISTHDEREFADLIEASPALGFLAKADLSAEAIYQTLAPDDEAGGVSVRRGI